MISFEWICQLIACLFVVGIWTVLYRDNPLFGFVSHILLGAAAGYTTYVMLQNIWNMGLAPLYAGNVLPMVPVVLGVLLFMTFTSTRWSWMVRYPAAVVVGCGTALALRSGIDAQIISQMRDTMVPFWTENLFTNFSNLVLIIIAVSCISFFLFTGSERGVLGRTMGRFRKLATYLLMFAFGSGVIGYLYAWYTAIAGVAIFMVDFLFGS